MTDTTTATDYSNPELAMGVSAEIGCHMGRAEDLVSEAGQHLVRTREHLDNPEEVPPPSPPRQELRRVLGMLANRFPEESKELSKSRK